MNGFRLFVKWFAAVMICTIFGGLLSFGGEALEMTALTVAGGILAEGAFFISGAWLVVDHIRLEKKRRKEMGDVQYEIEKQKKRDAQKLAAQKQAALFGVLSGTATEAEKEKLRRIRELERRDRAQVRQMPNINGTERKAGVSSARYEDTEQVSVSGSRQDLSKYGIEDPGLTPGMGPKKVLLLMIVVIGVFILAALAVAEVYLNSAHYFGG